MKWFRNFLDSLNRGIEQDRCTHPEYAREGKLRLFPEQDAVEYYEVCLNCGAVFDD